MELSETERKEAIEKFEKLGVCSQLAEAAANLKWKSPTPVQEQAVPLLLQGASSLQMLMRSSDFNLYCSF